MKLSRVSAAVAIVLAILVTTGCTQAHKKATGLLVITPQFQEVFDFSEGLAPVMVGTKWGYIDRTGKFVIKPKFSNASTFTNGVAGVSLDTNPKSGFAPSALIDAHGKIIRIFDEATFIDTFPHSIQVHYMNTLDPTVQTCRYISPAGQILYGKEFSQCGDFNEGLASVRDKMSGLFGFINTKGAWAIPPKYTGGGYFNNGIAAVQISVGGSKKLFGAIDNQDRWVLNPQFERMGNFSEGYARAGDSNGKTGFIDMSGKFAIPKIWYNFPMAFSGDSDFHSGYVIQYTIAGYRFMDAKNRFLGSLTFEWAGHFQDGYAPVKTKGKWGYLGLDGKYAVMPQFDQAGLYSEGLAPVKVGDLWGYIG